jgi:arabinogalactan endo-1,4-beta-galactosidase
MKKILAIGMMALVASASWTLFHSGENIEMQSIDSIACVGSLNNREDIDWILGIDANYALAMKKLGYRWRHRELPVDPFALFSDKGVNYFKIRLLVNDTGPRGLFYATETAKWAYDKGMEIYVALYLSDQPTDIVKQPAPKKWKDMNVSEKAHAIYMYSKNTTSYFIDNGIDADIYEIGNEIDYGLCGIFEHETVRRENTSWMRNHIWKNMSVLIKAAVDGIKSVDFSAAFVLHIAHWWDYKFSNSFFKSMIDFDVPFEYLGLSFYPSSGIYNLSDFYSGLSNGTWSQLEFQTTVERLFSTLSKPIIVSEYAYPSSDKIEGMFSSWNRSVEGYPLTSEGQKKWLRDFLEWCYMKQYIPGVFYFGPELYWYHWEPLSLFSNDNVSKYGEAKPAVDAFSEFVSNHTLSFITKPKEKHLYIADREITPILLDTKVIGEITIESKVYSISGIDRVEFYVDDELKYVDKKPPYEWLWDEKAFGRHTLKAVAYDKSHGSDSDEIEVIIFNLGG